MAHVRMRWKAANYVYQYPILICERAVLPLYPSFAQPTVITTNGTYRDPLRIEHSGVLLTPSRLVRPVSKVVVVREPPSRVEEKVQPSRRVCPLCSLFSGDSLYSVGPLLRCGRRVRRRR